MYLREFVPPVLFAGLLATQCFFLSSCSTSSPVASHTEVDSIGPPPLVRPTSLSREAAFQRHRQIGNISYQLWFKLEGDHLDFDGKTKIQFHLKPKAKDYG